MTNMEVTQNETLNNPLSQHIVGGLERKATMSEEITPRYHVLRREFLNKYVEMPGFVVGVVEDTRAIPDNDPEQGWNDGQINLALGDCYRRVTFEFSMYDADERANSLRKITLIAEVVNAVRDGIALEVESRNARPAETEQVTTETEQATTETEQVTAAEEVRTESDSRVQFVTSHFTTLGL